MINLGNIASGVVGSLATTAILLLTGASGLSGSSTLDVGRINIREPDGTLRMVLSNAALEPGIIVKGREQPHPSRRSAGILFYNNEGTENGGLIFDGQMSPNGRRQSSGSLTFDRYEQDQMVQIQATEDGSDRAAGLTVNDQPDQMLDFAAIERARHLPPRQQLAGFREAHAETTHRLFVGRQVDGASEITLKDAKGADRLILKVTSAGRASIIFLDSRGHVLRRVDPSSRVKLGG